MKKKKLSEIIGTMIKYRGKPTTEPLTQIENLLCLVAYNNDMNEKCTDKVIVLKPSFKEFLEGK